MWPNLKPITFGEAQAEGLQGPSMLNALRQQKEELQKAKLFNQFYGPQQEASLAHQQLQNKYFAPQAEADLAHKNALTKMHQFQMQNPLINSPEGRLAYMQSHPEQFGGSGANPGAGGGINQLQNLSPEQKNQLAPLMNAPLNMPPKGMQIPNPSPMNAMQQPSIAEMAQRNYMAEISNKEALANQRLMSKAYSSMPAAYKSNALAQARGFGYTSEEAAKLFNQGNTLADMAEAKGYGSDQANWPQAHYAPTTPTLNRIQRSNIANAGLNVVEPIVSKAIEPYSQRFAGYSPTQVIQALKGTNVDEQGKYLAALALQPEIAALRINAMGGNVGITAIQDMVKKAMGSANTYQSMVTPAVYSSMQKNLSEWIKLMNQAENKEVNKYQREGKEEIEPVTSKKAAQKDYTEKDIENTAKKYNMTREEVIKILGSKNG